MARIGDTARTSLKSILEAVLMVAGEPLSLANLATVFTDEERPSDTEISKALEELGEDYAERGFRSHVASHHMCSIRCIQATRSRWRSRSSGSVVSSSSLFLTAFWTDMPLQSPLV